MSPLPLPLTGAPPLAPTRLGGPGAPPEPPGQGAAKGAPRAALPVPGNDPCCRDSRNWGSLFSESQQRKSITAKMLWAVPRRRLKDLLFDGECCQNRNVFRPAQTAEKLIPDLGLEPSTSGVDPNFIAVINELRAVPQGGFPMPGLIAHLPKAPPAHELLPYVSHTVLRCLLKVSAQFCHLRAGFLQLKLPHKPAGRRHRLCEPERFCHTWGTAGVLVADFQSLSSKPVLSPK